MLVDSGLRRCASALTREGARGQQRHRLLAGGVHDLQAAAAIAYWLGQHVIAPTGHQQERDRKRATAEHSINHHSLLKNLQPQT
jgi:hypothetical protein